MLKLSNSKYLKVFFKLLLLLLIAKSISLVLLLLLPSDSIELNTQNNYQPKYQRVDFKNMIFDETLDKNTQTTNKNTSSIKNMILKGLYGIKDSGFIIVALKSAPSKTEIIEVGEVYFGYTLIQIANKNAIFEKNSKEYTLWLDLENQKTTKIKNKTLDQKIITREDISFYSKNPKQIWKEISIIEVKENKKIKGFKILKIDSNSKMATLGLRKNDLIIKVNNVVLKSYKDALDIYGKIGTMDLIQIVVIRNGIEKEIVYEIN
ncbi:MAG: hypothetical protein L3I99_05130 [Sulfurimonas sp.]|nr:hypothetical protein [Sulfurimonas sp.]